MEKSNGKKIADFSGVERVRAVAFCVRHFFNESNQILIKSNNIYYWRGVGASIMSMCSIFLLFLAPFSFALRNSI